MAQVEASSPALSPRYQLVCRYTDALVTSPRSIDASLREALAAEFTAAELVELTLTVTFASAFSKAAIAWGPPEAIPVLEVPTPDPEGSVT